MVAEADASEAEDAENSLSPDLVFDVLKNRRRRYALRYLSDVDGPVQLSELAEQVAAWENQTTIDEVSDAERKVVYTALYKSHLSKLDGADIIEHDQGGQITLNPDAVAEMEKYMNLPLFEPDRNRTVGIAERWFQRLKHTFTVTALSSEVDSLSGDRVKGRSSKYETIAELSDADNRLSTDLVFDVLKNRQRRYVLQYLRDADGPVQLSELAEQVAAWENDTTVEAVTAKDRKRTYTSLYQLHLPKLDDAGVIEYDQSGGVITLNADVISEIERYVALSAIDPKRTDID